MGRLLSDAEQEQVNLYHPTSEISNNGVGNRHGGDLFYNEGDNCVFSYEKDLQEALKTMLSSDGCDKQETGSCRQRLLVVANRLPISAKRECEDVWQLDINAGGLVSALMGLTGFEAKWIGWAGVNVPDEVGQLTLTKALAERMCIPVFLDEETVRLYYNGYCNKILWPLFHYIRLPQEDRVAPTQSYQSQFDEYKKANQMFADVVYKHYKDGDIVWCQDYHLMFLPQCLKEYDSKMKVGWFLHTPFPSSEIYRALPSRSELLRSVLAADIVGFHTYDYARHFVSACTRILGIEGTPEGVEDQGKFVRVTAFPIGMDSDRFIRALELPQVQNSMTDLISRFEGKKLMLGVDRLDMIKGIPQKILAFEKFLEDNPDWHHKVVLLQIAVPTRTDVRESCTHIDPGIGGSGEGRPRCNGPLGIPASNLYNNRRGLRGMGEMKQYRIDQKLARQVHEIVGRINGRFGTLTSVPIHHLDRSLDFQSLCALYAVTDVALVTSLRDGMNLVSYEFVACQASKKGVLILSEFAGAAQSLGAGAILVNPWNITQVASSIAYALNMSSEEREKRHQLNYMHVTTQTTQEWAKLFLSELNETVDEVQLRAAQLKARPLFPIVAAVERYVQSNNRLLILGFNATLTQSTESSSTRSDTGPKVDPDLSEQLRKISNDPKTTIIVLSGSSRNVLDENFGSYNMWLAAENGMFLRHTKGEWMTTMPECSSMNWVDSIKHVFEYFSKRTPRSYFEQRETSLLWNYKYADAEFGKHQARDLLLYLSRGPICSSPVIVLQGERSVEVRAIGVTKGAAIDRIVAEIFYSERMEASIDFVLCIGHFLAKDEGIYSFFKAEDSMKPVAVKAATPTIISAELKSFVESDRTGTHCRVRTCSAMEHVATSVPHEGRTILDVERKNYFSCAVGRKHTSAQYVLESSEDVVLLLKELANVCVPCE